MNSNYYKTEASVEEYIKLAKDVNGGQLIEKLNNYLPSNSSLLEIGSGPGTDFRLLKRNYNVVGSDYSTEFLNRLRSNNIKDDFFNLDAITIETDKKFDGIYSNKVLQHLTDEDLSKSILRQIDILNSGGIICHSFWKGEGSEIFKGLLVNYQTAESLRNLFEDYFEILLLEEYNEFEDGDSLLLIGKKK
ncbi:class I SAM-dependent methyltransferase [Arenibacter sp. F20364]|uniref:class I SAM-dependent methyltransferase n=1 Tax=Arenibacter sp. F20364 TaxID=2926415 RepID=UPI001FF67827|nr:class I SAM-dependent methyltransferase [Arenibacter sp. F20364]MCK0192501.1 class I SAM-dependent methyltransferase [Arenibacter sp. F20364]